MKRICPVRLAVLFQGATAADAIGMALRNQPRLRELAWWLQGVPGGVEAVAAELLSEHPQRFELKAMRDLGQPKGGRYNIEQCIKLWKEAPRGSSSPVDFDFLEWWQQASDGFDPARDFETNRDGARQKLQHGLEHFNHDYFARCCAKVARTDLADWLESLAWGVFRPPSFCPELIEVLFQMMDRWAAKIEASIAETEIKKIVFRELSFSEQERVPVPIIGDSRFGKTVAGRVFCESRPGLRRVVTVPNNNRERDFLEAHADAFGIDYTPETTTASLRKQVEFVVLQSGIFVLYDEAHALIPVRYNRTTPPARLNWVRSKVIDLGLACSFIATPQTYRDTVQRYVQTTGYNMEQWLGRMAPAVVLPNELGREDLMAVARSLFPRIDEDSLELMAAQAMGSEGYLQNLHLYAKRALFIAREHGRTEPVEADVERAFAEMAPGGTLTAPAMNAARPARAEKPRPAGPLPPSCNRSAGAVRPSQSGRVALDEFPVSESRRNAPALASVRGGLAELVEG